MKSSIYISSQQSPKVMWLLKLLLLALVGYVLYDQIVLNKDMATIKYQLQKGLEGSNWIYLVGCVLLMPINWLIESVKWRMLILPWKNLTKIDAMKAIYAGISVGLVTPARIGEYGGRLLLIDGEDRIKSIPATLISSIAQNISNIIGGYIGALIFCYCYFSFNRYVYIVGSILGLLVIIMLCALFFNISKLKLDGLNRWWLGKLLNKQAHIISQYDRPILKRVLTLSYLRYLIYCTQYVLILDFLGLELSLLAAFSGVAVIYLFQSGIPLPPILSVIARGELAIVIWSLFTANVGGILVATFGLWVINLVFPALLGLLIILNVNFLKSSQI
ncbi:MAG: lysylphosphatidylglycerol synthase domain-containing protein [Saprospiraceae bacterium]|nr:lysylphosphatidylglycerol synthase domain-containing protein [Saprospiraceae bacterium]